MNYLTIRGAFAEAMRSRSFTDHEPALMFKANPTRLLGLEGPSGQKSAIR
jgi:hypothetical protein